MKLVLVVFVIVSMVLTSSFFQAAMAQPVSAPPGAQTTCGKKCGVRCIAARYNSRCLKYCGICCDKCNGCVPSGTSGNKDECPCYRDMLNSKGKPKCP